jgi:sugar phosphate isomerase/epimerase
MNGTQLSRGIGVGKSMVLGCGEWGFRNRSMAEYFELATSFGFKHLEFGLGGGWPGRLPEQPTVADIAAFRQLADRHHVTTHYCCLENDFTRSDSGDHTKQLQRVLDQLPAVADGGARLVRLFAGFTPYEEMTETIWARLIAAMVECSLAAERRGMSIAIETHGTIAHLPNGIAVHRHTVTTHRDGLARLLQELPSSIGFNYDPGNLKAADPADRRYAADLLANRVTYCHLKDWKPVGEGWIACAPGDDDLDYSQILPVSNFEGAYLIEYEPLEDTVDGLNRSLSYLRRTFPQATLS